MSENSRSYIKDWYQTLGTNGRKRIREAYDKRFNPKNPQNLYASMKNNNLTLDKLVFFAEQFQCSVDDLLAPPIQPRIRPNRQAQQHLELHS